MAFSDSLNGWAVGAGGVIIATTDGGATWNAQTSGATADLAAVAFSDANHGRAEGAGGTALATADGGTTWGPDATAPTGNVVSLADGPGRIAYALTAGGHVERTLSNGAAPLSLSASTAALKAGRDVHLTVSSPIRAPGSLVLEGQLAGGSWQKLAPAWPWSTSPGTPGGVSDEPLTTTSYRLRFVFAGHTAATSATVTVGVQPQIALTRTSFSLRKEARLPADRPRLSHRARSQGHRLDQPRRHLASGAGRRPRGARPRNSTFATQAVWHAQARKLQAAGTHGGKHPVPGDDERSGERDDQVATRAPCARLA